MVTVCLPSQQALSLASPLPGGVEVVIWDGSGPAPDNADQTEFLVLMHNSSFTAMFVGDAAAPGLVQTLSAGVDYLVGLIPSRLKRCAMGAGSTAAALWPSGS